MKKAIEETKRDWKDYFEMQERLKVLFEQNIENGLIIRPIYEKNLNNIPLSEKEKKLVSKKLRESEIIAKRVDMLLSKLDKTADNLGFNDENFVSLN